VDNNEIFDVSRVAAVGNDAITPRGVGHIIRHNTIYNGQYTAVRYHVIAYVRHCLFEVCDLFIIAQLESDIAFKFVYYVKRLSLLHVMKTDNNYRMRNCTNCDCVLGRRHAHGV